MRWLASGPRCGLGELLPPENEPGSSIMPGKVNPTQCEAMVMIAIQVIGDDNGVAFAGSQGNFELNALRPIKLNENRINQYVEDSVMLVTALSPVIGYDKASRIAHKEMDEGLTLRQAALESGYVSKEQFDQAVDPVGMVGNGFAGA